MINSFQERLFYRVVGMLGLLALVVTALPQAVASQITCEYKVDIASSERLVNALALPTDDEDIDRLESIRKSESCDDSYHRKQVRNRPAILVQNIGCGGPESDLVSFTMTIKKADYVFGTGDNTSLGTFDGYVKRSAYMKPEVQITGSSVSSDGKMLTVDFAGLSVGKSAIFRIDLDMEYSDQAPYPDFREVLFDEDEDGNSTANTGVTMATFLSGGLLLTTPETRLGDLEKGSGSVNNNCCTIDPVVSGGGGGSVAVPEPASLLLLLTGLVGTSLLGRTKR